MKVYTKRTWRAVLIWLLSCTKEGQKNYVDMQDTSILHSQTDNIDEILAQSAITGNIFW